MNRGEMADYRKAERTVSISKVDVSSHIAWKNGYFIFVDETLEDIMGTLSLW